MKLLTILLLAPLLLLGQELESALNGTNTLTDKEEYEAENYIHQGMANRVYEEECFDEEGNFDHNKCASEEAYDPDENKFMSTVDNMMPIVGKLYALLGLSGQKVKMKEGEDKVDLCSYIPMALEAAALAQQSANNNQIQQNYQKAKPEAKQKASFDSLSKMHSDKSKTSGFQAAGWFSVAGCYATYAAFGAAIDAKMIAKFAASTTIGYFYTRKQKAHKDKAEAIAAMAAKLPGAGDCNPHTDTSCFCAEERSYDADRANFMKYCVPPELARDGNVIGTACVDDKGKADLSCKCKKTNSCIHAKLQADAMQLGLNPAKMKDPLAGIGHLSKGAASGNLKAINDRNLAMAKEAMKKYKPSEKINLNSKEAKKMAEELFKMGLPKGVAASLASQASGLSPKLPESAGSVASLNPSAPTSSSFSDFNRGTNRKKSGGSIGKKGSSFSKSSNPFARKSYGSSSRTSGVDIMDFASEATRAAEITKDKSKPIFDIITYRYKMRAWKEFEEEMRENIKEKKD